MNSSAPNDPEPEPAANETTIPAGTAHRAHGNHPDPITGEPDAHPIGVGVGALSAGAAGAAIGAFAGPIGVVVGAAIGAIAGGLAGKEAAETADVSPVPDDDSSLASFEREPAVTDEETPLSESLADRTTPADDAFFTAGSVHGTSVEPAIAPLDEFDRPHGLTAPTTTSAYHPSAGTTVSLASTADDDAPLPTASSGLITPDESSSFADSTTGESSVLAESPLPAATAVSAEPEAPTPSTHQSLDNEPLYTEHLIRTGAYYRFLNRETAGQPGDELSDWLAAENEIMPS